MRKISFAVIAFIIVFLWMFPLDSFGKNTTEIKLNVYEVKVNCDENGSFIVKSNNYANESSFFIGRGGDISIIAIPKKGYMVESIEGISQCEASIKKQTITLTNITDNINVNITFKPIEIPFAGKGENIKTDIVYCWILSIIIIIILMIIIYVLWKKNNKNK